MKLRVKNQPKITLGRNPAVEVFEGAGAPGLVPNPITEDGRFLRDDGTWSSPAGSGDVVGPASAVNNRIAVYDGTTGKLIKDGGQTIAQVIAAAPVQSVSGKTGTVILDADDVGAPSGSGTSTGTNTGDQTITLTGDVTGSGTGTFAATIANDAVTFAKMQNIGSGQLIGRHSSGSGDPETVGIDGGLEIQGSNIRRSALTGAITASAGSNTTALGSFTKAQLDTAISDGNAVYEGDNVADLVLATATTGTAIDFTSNKIFGSPASPETGNITDDLTGAKIGVVQKIYHNHSVAPTVPAGWVLIGSGTYTTSVLNIIYAEWVSGNRVEYWIVQEA